MGINGIIFPAPPPKYTLTDFENQLIWVPKQSENTSIPCLLLQSETGSNKIMLYFHGNAEDLKLSFELIDLFRKVLHIHVLAVEYPGYGIYESKTSAEQIVKDAETVYEFVKSRLNFEGRDIFVFGRSIGTGPATHLARYKKLGCLLLMSGFTSIKAVVRNVAGRISSIIKERFNNIENMKHVTCSTFIVHGKKDTFIPYTHSQSLHETCRGPCSLFIPSNMDHDNFDYCDDLVLPISSFLIQSRISLNDTVNPLNLTSELFSPSPGQKLRTKGGRIYNLLRKFS